MINVHAATNEKKEEIQEFYNLLEQNINQIANSDIRIILGEILMLKLVKKARTNPPVTMKIYIQKPLTLE